MKRLLIFVIAVTMVWFSTPAMADHASTTAGDYAGGVATSRHNLSASGSHVTAGSSTVTNNLTDATGVGTTTEICVFCHTPHHTSTTAAPLWNRTDTGVSFTTYGNGAENGLADFDGRTYVGKTTVGDPKWGSLACLTCHDGVTTFDALINRPGKGTGAPVWNMWMGTMDLNQDSMAGNFTNMDGGAAARLVIGTDLTNDHPISLRYRGGSVASLRGSSTTISSINMCNQQENLTCAGELVTGNLWAIAGFINDNATIADLLRGDTSGGGGPTVECSSCHDPHYKNLTNPEANYVSTRNTANDHTEGENDGLFLRRVGGNSDSGVCRTCHAKADAI